VSSEPTEPTEPSPDADRESVAYGDPLVQVRGLSKFFSNQEGFLGPLRFERDGTGVPHPTWGREWVRAVDDVTFDIKKGETLGLVGESGCGKSTLARTLLHLLDPTDGDVYFKGRELTDLRSEELRVTRRDMQMIFQDPQSSLDPRMKVGPIIEEPMKAHGLPSSDPSVTTTAAVDDETGYEVRVTVDDDVDVGVPTEDGVATAHVELREREVTGESDEREVHALAEEDLVHARATLDEEEDVVNVRVAVPASQAELRQARARELLEKVGLDPQHYNRYPHQFSGGQRQRINLARALSVNPDFIVCDEPTSALDASIQAQVLNTMDELQDEFGLTYLFISHDLSVIRYIADRVAVMYLGEIVELADKEELFENPQHPYTEALLSAIPVPDPRSTETRSLLKGDVPSPIDPPSGCRFRTRCPKLIAPAEFALSKREWDEVREFMRAVTRGEPSVTDASDRREVSERFFSGATPGGEAGRIVEEALDRLADEDLDAAADMLRTEFAEKSICAREVPSYQVEPEHGTAAHYAHCHLNRDE
jgi:oligopeptide/dipeptide ABC transporter ATP-binding protein